MWGYRSFFIGVFAIFLVLATQADKKDNKTVMIIYAALALLFQPFFKIALGRDLWNVIDVLVGIGLLVSIIIKTQERIL
jgi:hypothetical protein